jgi:hypothetical protein
MFVVRKVDLEVRNELPSLTFCTSNIAEAGKKKSRSIAWRYFDVAVGANDWSRPLPREKLRTMAVETG